MPEGLKGRFEPLEKWISKLKDRSIEIFQSNKQKEKNINNRVLENCSASTSTLTCILGVSEGKTGKGKSSICRNNDQKLPKFDEKNTHKKKTLLHIPKKSSTNSMKDKFKEIHTRTVK